MIKEVKWLVCFWIVITGFCGLTYTTVQQNYRQGANDPQIQIAEDTASKLSSNDSVESVVPKEKVDISKSLAPFVIVFDLNGKPVTGSAILNGKIPTPPVGVFEYAKKFGENRLTWQPQENVRIASVIVPYSGKEQGFVLAGRSLREVEKREEKLEFFVAAVWALAISSVTATIFVLSVAEKIHKK